MSTSSSSMPISSSSSSSSITQTETQQHGATVPIETTITSASSICTAALEGQVLSDGATALIVNSDGGFITLNNTCRPKTATQQMRTTTVTRIPLSTSSQSSYTTHHQPVLSAGMIAGLVLAIVAVLFAILGFAGWLWYRRRSRMSVINMPAKTLDEDASNEISFRWEKDGAEIKELSAAEIKEMEADRPPVEIGDARSIRQGNNSTVELETAVSPISVSPTSTKLDEIVSPLSPKYRT